MRRETAAAWSRLGTVLMPLVDLVMLLVLFFALAQGVVEPTRVPVELPLARAGAENDSQRSEPVVTLAAAGMLYLDGSRVGLDVLVERLAHRPLIQLRADGDAAYARVREVLAALRAEGVGRVRLVVSEDQKAVAGGAP